MSEKLLKEIPDTSMLALEEAVASREIGKAMKILAELTNAFCSLPQAQRNACRLLAYLAWGIDFDRSYLAEVEKVLPRFRKIPLGSMPLDDLIYRNVAEGLVKLHREMYDQAIDHFNEAIKDADRAKNVELMTIVRYYLGTCYWKKLDYKKAIAYIRDAKERDEVSKRFKRVAAMELVEAWLLFLIGKIADAKQALEHAKSELEGTDSYVDYANAISFEGRLAREAGDNTKALQCFFEAISWYQRCDPSHRNIARSYINIAFVYRLLARDLASSKPCSTKSLRHQVAQEVERLRRQSFEQLEKATEIYGINAQKPCRGLGKIHNLRALLYFDSCEFDKAEAETEAAYSIGSKLNDHLIMADARVIQATLALDEDKEGNALAARRFAEDAVFHATKTENRRLKARAFIRLALALLKSPADLQHARILCAAASNCLVKQDNDYLRQTLDRLKSEILSHPGCGQTIEVTVPWPQPPPLKQITRKFKEEAARQVYRQTGGKICDTQAMLRCDRRIIEDAIATFRVTENTLAELESESVSQDVLRKLECLKDQEIQGKANFVEILEKTVGNDLASNLKSMIMEFAKIS